MKRTFKKSLSLVLAVLMVMTVMPFAGAADHEHVFANYEYLGDAYHVGKCTVSGCKVRDYSDCSGGTATCQSGAICAKCNAEYTEPSTVHGDKTVEIGDEYIATPANCKNKATYYYACEDCGAPIKDGSVFTAGEVDPDNHQFTAVLSNGNRTHNAKCGFCDVTVTNVACYDEEPAITDATCTVKGKAVHTCDVCSFSWETEIAATGHDYTKKSGVVRAPATCTQHITYWYMCKNCPANAKDDAAAADKYYEGADILNHNYNQKDTAAQYIVSAATCQQKASYYYSCECGASSKGTAEEKKFDGEMGTHTWGEYSSNNDATCTENGTKTATCIINGCNATNTIEAEGTAKGHTYTRHVEKADRIKDAGDCQTFATYYLTCARCDAFSTDDNAFFEGSTKGPHKFDGATIDESNYQAYIKTPATCTSVADFYKYCSACGASSKGTENEDTFKYGTTLPHNYQAIMEDKFIRRKPTCEDKALYSKSCKDCGHAIVPANIDPTAPGAVVNPDDVFEGLALGHDMKTTGKRREATCLIEGVTEEQTCQRSFAGQPCGHKVGGEKIEKLAHQYKEIQKYSAPTCKRNGQYGQKKCELCNTTIYLNEKGETVAVPLTLAATGHADIDGDLICEKCDAYLEPSDVCECLCHSTNGIMYFIAKLIKWFWKFTNSNQMCECGEAHY